MLRSEIVDGARNQSQEARNHKKNCETYIETKGRREAARVKREIKEAKGEKNREPGRDIASNHNAGREKLRTVLSKISPRKNAEGATNSGGMQGKTHVENRC